MCVCVSIHNVAYIQGIADMGFTRKGRDNFLFYNLCAHLLFTPLLIYIYIYSLTLLYTCILIHEQLYNGKNVICVHLFAVDLFVIAFSSSLESCSRSYTYIQYIYLIDLMACKK